MRRRIVHIRADTAQRRRRIVTADHQVTVLSH
jgi:hypothetical protein